MGSVMQMSAGTTPSTGPAYWLEEGSFLLFDLETTGVATDSDLPVSYAMAKVDGGRVTETKYALVDPGIAIPPASMAIHQITDEMVRDQGVDLTAAVSTVANALLDASEEGRFIVGMNVSFDLSIMDSNAQRLLGSSLVKLGFDAPILDILVLDRHFDRYRKGKRKLVDLCGVYGVSVDGLHNSLTDALATFEVLKVMVSRHPEIATHSPEEITVLQRNAAEAWSASHNAWRSEKGLPLIEVQGWPIH